MNRLIAVALSLAVLTFGSTADARPKHAPQELTYCASDQTYRRSCHGGIQRIQRHASRSGRANTGVTIIGGRPPGCPHRYCGCGARLYLGISDKRLNLASNWKRYYHGTTPVAVWPHHVAIIVRYTGPRTAILRDYNSGGGLSRIHERSIGGAVIVGGKLAGL